MTWLHGMSIGIGVLTTGCFGGTILRFFAPAQKWSGLRLSMTVSFCLCAFLQCSALINCREVGPGYRVTGLMLFLAAHGLFWSALAVHWHRPPAIVFSEQPPCSLVTRGPYTLIRHPFYTSYTLAWLAGVCITADASLLVTPIWMFVFYYRAAVSEETQLLASPAFGARYDQYRQQTGMFIPRW